MTETDPTCVGASAEDLAAAVQVLPAFRNLNLGGVRDAVTQILGLIGRDGLFREYTLHDISHVDDMLGVLQWLVPEETAAVMSPADWLLAVLAVYFHDAGMVVTEAEFAAREETDFREFCETDLFAGPNGAEYRNKVQQLKDDADRFLYEEFVRKHHADRIADWILGRGGRRHGVPGSVADEVARTLAPLPEEFRRDLALVCQSHHLNDLHDTAKYRVSQPYGNSEAETANVQYAALLLRSADLLSITSGRAPALMYRLIDPQDPVSQREWAKQNAVRRVRAQKGRDREGRASDVVAKSVVEVFATFTSPDGFFGLTSYLQYAARELAQTHDWARESAEENDLAYHFPWRRVDDTDVNATGFLPERLGFSLDQDKILDLLTGHTLYNDTSVVIRELVQNSLDACRLQAVVSDVPPTSCHIDVIWDSESRVLTIRDDGTGMSQEVIERNLLKAGASRYQEDAFRAAFPSFSPISRFGIGVLSTFMIADSVTITTCSVEDVEARQLTLRSVRGRYLVELLDKDVDERALRLAPHGTEVELRVRASAKMPDVLATMRRWIVIPGCTVTATVDGGEPVRVGYESPTAALRDVMKALDYDVSDGDDEATPGSRRLRIIERDDDGICTAFAVSWSPYFREWSFVSTPSGPDLERRRLRLGTCVEGIRVEDTTPGFSTSPILALCNATGLGAPKTNVARSGLESTPERTELLRRIYAAYLEHVSYEANELADSRGMSLTWAAQEAAILLRPLFSGRGSSYGEPGGDARLTDPALFDRELSRQPLILIEGDGKRSLVSADDLRESELVWSVDSEFVRAAERLLREVKSRATLSSLASGLASEAFDLPLGPTFAGSEGSVLPASVLRHRHVGQVVIRRDQRRIDLGWTLHNDNHLWIQARQIPGRPDNMLIARENPIIEGRDGEVAIRALGRLYLFADNPLASYLVQLHDQAGGQSDSDLSIYFSMVFAQRFLTRWARPENITDYVDELIEDRAKGAGGRLAVVREGLIDALTATPSNVFDTSAWSRRDED